MPGVRRLVLDGEIVTVPDTPEDVKAAVYNGAKPLDPQMEAQLLQRDREQEAAGGLGGMAEAFGNAATMGIVPAAKAAGFKAAGDVRGATAIAQRAQDVEEANPVSAFAGAVAPAIALDGLGSAAVEGFGAKVVAKGASKAVMRRAGELAIEQGLQSGITAGANSYLREEHLNTDPNADSETIASHILRDTLLGTAEGALMGGIFGAGEGLLGQAAKAARAGKNSVASTAGMLSRDALDSGTARHFEELALRGEDAQALAGTKGAHGDTLGEVMYGANTAEKYREGVVKQAIDDMAASRQGVEGIVTTLQEAAEKHGISLDGAFNGVLKEADDIVRDMPGIKRGIFDNIGADNTGELAKQVLGLSEELTLSGKTMRSLKDLGEGEAVKVMKEARAALEQAREAVAPVAKKTDADWFTSLVKGEKAGPTVGADGRILAEGLERSREALAKLTEKIDMRAPTPAQARLLALEERITRALSDEALVGPRAARGYKAVRKFGDDLRLHDNEARAFLTKDATGARISNKGAWVEAVKGMDSAATAEQVKKALAFGEVSGRFRNEVMNALGGTGKGALNKVQSFPTSLIPTAKPAIESLKGGISQAVKSRDVAKLVENALGQGKKLAGGGVGNQAAGVALFSLMTGHNPLVSAIPLVAGKVKSAVSEVLGANPIVSAARLRNWQAARQYGAANTKAIAEAVAKGHTSFVPPPKIPGGALALLGKLQTITPQALQAAAKSAASVMPTRGTMAAVASMQALNYLSSTAPKPMGGFKDVDPLVQRMDKDGTFAKDRYNPVELRQFERRAGAVMHPDIAFKRWGQGQLTTEEADALRSVYPRQVQMQLDALRDAMIQSGGRVSYSTAWRYKMLAPIGTPAIAASMSEEFTKATQDAYERQATAAANGGDGGNDRAPVTTSQKLDTNPAAGAAPSVALDAQMRTR